MPSPLWIRIIGLSQVVGGCAGYVLLGITAFQQPRLGIPPELRLPLIWYLAGAVAFTGAVIAGVLLLRRRTSGVIASTIIQASQIVQFTIPGTFVYQFATGVQILLFVSPSLVRFSPGVNASFTALPLPVPAPWSVGINLFALLGLVILLRARGPASASTSDATAVGVAAG